MLFRASFNTSCTLNQRFILFQKLVCLTTSPSRLPFNCSQSLPTLYASVALCRQLIIRRCPQCLDMRGCDGAYLPARNHTTHLFLLLLLLSQALSKVPVTSWECSAVCCDGLECLLISDGFSPNLPVWYEVKRFSWLLCGSLPIMAWFWGGLQC